MKLFASLLFGFTAYSAELIHISKDPALENLEVLSAKYAQNLLVNGNDVYIIPKECQLERYFGGTSQGELNLVHAKVHTEAIIPTQEVFEAKDTTVIEKKIEQEKAVLLVEGKISKAFLDDKEGRGFGGESEVPLDLSLQKDQMIASTSNNTANKNPTANKQRPSCQLLENGSGYKLYFATNPQFYANREFTSIVNDTILFK